MAKTKEEEVQNTLHQNSFIRDLKKMLYYFWQVLKRTL